jgi:hypothetical protein
MVLLFASCGCSWDVLTVSAGAIDAADTRCGSGKGDTFQVEFVESGSCILSHEYDLQFDNIDSEGGELSRLTFAHGYWFTYPPPLFFRTVVGGGAHWTNRGDWGLGPSAEATVGVMVPLGGSAGLSAELFAAFDLWLGSGDDGFAVGAGGNVGWRLALTALFLE